MTIPNLLHFVYGCKPQTDDFELYKYLAVASAVAVNKPVAALVHYAYEPHGPWWTQLKRLRGVVLEKVALPTEVLGRPLKHYAHQADVIRLAVLREYGGIYLDIDTLCIQPFAPLLAHEFVMGWQGQHGLCNAVMLSVDGSVFLQRWQEQYRWFRGTGKDKPYWDEHSVLVPARLATLPELREHLTVLPTTAFFFPLWTEFGYLLKSSDPRPFFGSFVTHLWETITGPGLRIITLDWLCKANCNYANLARPFLP